MSALAHQLHSSPHNRRPVIVFGPVGAFPGRWIKAVVIGEDRNFIVWGIGEESVQHALNTPNLIGWLIGRCKQIRNKFLTLWTLWRCYLIMGKSLHMLTEKTPECGMQYAFEYRRLLFNLSNFLWCHALSIPPKVQP
jgi:hypothetical protein